MAAEPEKLLMKPQDAARLMDVTVHTIYRLMGEGALPRVQIRRAVRTRRDAVLRYIEQQSAAAQSA